jgi:toxin ParE1/3/4
MRVVFTKSAIAELDEIFFYIARVNPAAAARVATRIEDLTFQLGQFPNMGRPKYKPGVLRVPVRKYPFLIFYKIHDDEVQILSVRHAARRVADAPE